MIYWLPLQELCHKYGLLIPVLTWKQTADDQRDTLITKTSI